MIDTPSLANCAQLQTPRFNRRVALRVPGAEFTPRRLGRLKFDSDEGECEEGASKAINPFDCGDSDEEVEGIRRVPWPVTPETGGRVAKRDEHHASTPTVKPLALTPDPRAFGSDGLRKKTPRTKRPVCPPTPAPPPVHIERHASLWEAKILDSLSSGEAGLDHFLHRDFADFVPIGGGSFFEVYKARNRVDGQIFALKRSRKAFRGRNDRESYLREARYLNLLGSSPHVVEYHRAWQEDGHFIVQMEFCEANLSDMLSGDDERQYDEGFVWDCIYQIALGLRHVHNSQLLHLDIKPENILVTKEKVLKVADFGQSVPIGSVQDGREGDCRYLAPELVDRPNGYQLTPAADVFSVGVLAFELLTQLELPSGGSEWHRLRDGTSPRTYMNDICCSNEIVGLIVSMLDPNPLSRPSADEVVATTSRAPRHFSYPDVVALLAARQVAPGREPSTSVY